MEKRTGSFWVLVGVLFLLGFSAGCTFEHYTHPRFCHGWRK